MPRSGALLMLWFAAATSVAADIDSWRWNYSSVHSADPVRAAERSVAAAVSLDGNGIVLDPDPDGAVRSYSIIPAEALQAYEASLRSIDPGFAQSWSTAAASGFARIAALREEIEAFTHHADAMPTLAAFLQRECDRAYVAAHGAIPRPFIVVAVVAAAPARGARSTLLSSLKRAARPYDDLHVLVQKHGPKDVRLMRPIVSASSHREIYPRLEASYYLDAPRGRFLLLEMDAASIARLRRALAAYSEPRRDIRCLYPGWPEKSHQDLRLDYSLEHEKVPELEKAALSEGRVSQKLEGPADEAPLKLSREYIAKLEAEEIEYNDFIASRPVLGGVLRSSIEELRSDILRLEKGQRLTCVSVRARETH